MILRSINELNAILDSDDSDMLVIQTSEGVTKKILKSDLLKGKADGLNYDNTNSKLQILSGDTVLDEIEIFLNGENVPLDDVTLASATVSMRNATLVWSDPDDVTLNETTLAYWRGTKVVRKEGGIPLDVTDGTLVVNNKTRNQYASTGYVDEGLEFNKTYYYRFFPYTYELLTTKGSSVSVTPTRISLPIPTQDMDNIPEFDGTEKTAVFLNYDSTKMSVSGNKATDIDIYTAVFTLNDGYCWSDGSIEDKSVNWTLSKKIITVPSQNGSLTYNGSVQSATWNDYNTTYMTISGDDSATNAGTHTATFTLLEPNNCKWENSDEASIEVDWVINKASGEFSVNKTAISLDTVHTYKDIVINNTGDGVVQEPVSSDNSVISATIISSTKVRINNVNQTDGTATVTISIADGTNYAYSDNTVTISVDAFFSATIYGAEWDGTSTTTWTRTNSSADFTDPNPAVNGGIGSSPFDNLYPWSEMEIVEDENAGSVVKIPKFYYKWTRTGKAMKLQIADSYVDGFYTSPAHADREDGKGERDYVYVGRYHCAADVYKSISGVAPQTNKTRAEFRNIIHNLGSNVWQWDFAMYWTICMLYLVEFADWSSQAKIGLGCANSNNGSTDSMQYHTGATGSRQDLSIIQYRNIEGLWCTVLDAVDGIYYNGTNTYCIKNPSDFSDTENGILVGQRATNTYIISAWTNPTVEGFEYALIPSETNGGDNAAIYISDYYFYSEENTISIGGLNDGGNYAYGLFYLSYHISGNLFGSRLMVLP